MNQEEKLLKNLLRLDQKHMHAERKKAKGTKKCVIERELMFENYKDCLFNGGVILKSQQRFKCDR